MGPQAIICDIDDTVFEEDNNYKPIKNVIEFLQHHAQNYKIIMMTARFEAKRDFTIGQLRDAKIPFDLLIMESNQHPNHGGRQTVEHGIWKGSEVIKLMDKYNIVLFIDNNKHARDAVKKLGIKTKKPENIENKVLTKTLWSGIFI